MTSNKYKKNLNPKFSVINEKSHLFISKIKHYSYRVLQIIKCSFFNKPVTNIFIFFLNVVVEFESFLLYIRPRLSNNSYNIKLYKKKTIFLSNALEFRRLLNGYVLSQGQNELKF